MRNKNNFGRKLRVFSALTAAVIFMSSCTGVQEYHYLTDNVSGTILQVPKEWKILEGRELLKVVVDRLPEADTALLSRWLYGFSAEQGATGATLLAPTAAKPGGYVRSRYITPAELNDGVKSMSAKRLLELMNDMAILPASGEIISKAGFGVSTLSGVSGFGYDLVLRFQDGEMRVRYIAVVDPRVGQIDTLLIGCSTSCYTTYEKEITAVSESFTVVDPAALK